MLYPDLSHKIVGAFIAVHNSLGPGLLELPYRKTLYFDFLDAGIPVSQQVIYRVKHHDRIVGEYYADLVIDSRFIIEVKSVDFLSPIMAAQLINYLRIASIPAGYLVNFRNDKVEWRRFTISSA